MGTESDDKSLQDAAEKLAEGKGPEAAALLTGFLVTALTVPVLGPAAPFAGKLTEGTVRRFAERISDSATKRMLAAGQRVDEERANALALRRALSESLDEVMTDTRAAIEALGFQSQEQFLQLVTFARRHVSKKLDELLRQGEKTHHLVQQVYRGMEGLLHAQATAVIQVPHGLPAPPADFCGRDREIAELLADADADSPVLLGVSGSPGAGKTALALRVADSMTSRYPDGQAFLDLRGAGDNPMDPLDAIGRLLRAWQVGRSVPDDLAEAAAAYRTALHGKRGLLVLDNARDAAQLEQLLPPHSCALVVTSRTRVSLPGLRAVHLEELEDEPARSLVRRIAPRLRVTESMELAEACGRLPLALRLASARLAEAPSLPAQQYIADLKTAAGKAELVAASVQLSVDALAPALRDFWLKLSIFPGDFELTGAAFVGTIDQMPDREPWVIEQADAAESFPKTAQALGELVRQSLVEWDARRERYRLHDALRAYGNQHAGTDLLWRAASFHAAFFVFVATRADSLYRQGGRGGAEGLALFDLERHNIQSGQSWAAAHVDDQDRFPAMICHDYAKCSSDCPRLRFTPGQLLAWADPALRASRRLGETVDALAREVDVAIAHRRLGNPRRAMQTAELAVERAKQMGERRLESNAMNIVGLSSLSCGDIDRAIEIFEGRLKIVTELGDRRGLTSTLENLGLAHKAAERWAHALKYLQDALAVAQEIPDAHLESLIRGEIGMALWRQDPAGAMVQLEAQLAHAKSVGDRTAEAVAIGGLALAHRQMGNQSAAIVLFNQEARLARLAGDAVGEVTAGWNLGQVYLRGGEYARALEAMRPMLDHYRRIRHAELARMEVYVQEVQKLAGGTGQK